MKISSEDTQYIKDNYRKLSWKRMAENIGKPYPDVKKHIQILLAKGEISKFSTKEKTLFKIESYKGMPVKQALITMHLIEEKSVLNMSKELGISHRCIADLMDELGIHKRSKSEHAVLRFQKATQEERNASTAKATEKCRQRNYEGIGFRKNPLCGAKNPNWTGNTKTYTCDHCGKEFKRMPASAQRNSYFMTCSDECRTATHSKFFRGESHPAWDGGRRDNRIGWKEIVIRIQERDGYKCQLCGNTDIDQLHTHHKIPFRITLDDDDDNLITLCRMCHLAYEWLWFDKTTDL